MPYSVYVDDGENRQFNSLWQLLDYAEKCADNGRPLGDRVITYQPQRGATKHFLLMDNGSDIITVEEDGTKRMTERWQLVPHVPNQTGWGAGLTADWAE